MARHKKPEQQAHDPLASSIGQYLQHGDARPSERFLTSATTHLLRRGESTNASSLLIAADMYIDLAMQGSAASEAYLNKAEELVFGVYEQANYMRARGYDDVVKLSPLIVAARLRGGEIHKWRSAAAGEVIRPQYSESLAAASNSVSYAMLEDKAASSLIEFMPVLLAERKGYYSGSLPWLGRLALLREEQRLVQLAGMNANWDLGISYTTNAEDFDKPANKYQVKITKNSNSRQYDRSGIKMLKARTAGFANPSQIVYSCLWESGLVAIPDNIEVMSPADLDSLTDHIGSRL